MSYTVLRAGFEISAIRPITETRFRMRALRFATAAFLTLALPLQPVLAQAPAQLKGTPQHVYTNAVATIRGVALTARDNPLADARVRLRNARTGRIAGMKITDQAGLFEFASVEPGSYIVELV